MQTLVIWKTFCNEKKKLVGPGSVLVFLEHLEVQILKVFQNLGVGLMDLLVCPILYIYIYIYIYI